MTTYLYSTSGNKASALTERVQTVRPQYIILRYRDWLQPPSEGWLPQIAIACPGFSCGAEILNMSVFRYIGNFSGRNIPPATVTLSDVVITALV